MIQAFALDLSVEAFSCRGSYLSIAYQPNEPLDENLCSPLGAGLYLRSHHARAVIDKDIALFQCYCPSTNALVDFDVEAKPWCLSLKPKAELEDPEANIQIVFDDSGRFRIRGRSLGLRLTTPPGKFAVPYWNGEGEFCLNARYVLRRYQFSCLRAELKHTEPKGAGQQTLINIDAGEGKYWDLAIEEYWSSWKAPSSYLDFKDVYIAAQKRWVDFRDSHPAPKDESWRFSWERALYVNWCSIVKPEGLLKREAMFMSKWWMDQVWSWDHCFNAQAHAGSQDQLAWDQLRVPFDMQDEHGAIPDGMNDIFKHYNFCKPPVHGWTLVALLERCKDLPEKEELELLLNQMEAHTRWYLRERILPGEKLPYYLHGNDSGWDNSTMFDQGVPLISPDLSALLVLQLEALGTLAEKLGQNQRASRFRHESKELLTNLIDECWKEDGFVPFLWKKGQKIIVKSNSLIPNIPVILGNRLGKEKVAQLAKNIEPFVTEFGVATERPDSQEYTSDGYWRGPVWGPSTHLIVRGLADGGQIELSKRIARGYCEACRQSGFAENFDALNGKSLRDPAYTWTSSVFLILLKEFL